MTCLFDDIRLDRRAFCKLCAPLHDGTVTSSYQREMDMTAEGVRCCMVEDCKKLILIPEFCIRGSLLRLDALVAMAIRFSP